MEKYIKITTAIKATGGWITEAAALFITGYNITESRQIGEATGVKNIMVNTSVFKDIDAKTAGEQPFQPAMDMTNPFPFSVYLSNVTGAITDTKVFTSTLAYFTDKGYTVEIVEATIE